MAKTASRSKKHLPSGRNKPTRKGKKKLGGTKRSRKVGPLPDKPLKKRVARSKAKKLKDPLPGPDPFEL